MAHIFTMRKTKKTLKFLKKELTGIFRMKKSQYNLSDNKIGFVIDPEAKQEEQLVYILTTQKERPTYWDIWPARYENDESKKRSVREYAQALFILLSYAIRKASAECNTNHSKPSAIRIYRTDNTYSHCVKRVFDVITSKEYAEISSNVRKDLRPLLASVGRRGEKGRIEIAADCLQRVFFWNIRTVPFYQDDFKKCIRDKTPLLLSMVPANSFDLNEILALSERIRKSSPIKTWQDLYRLYVTDNKYMPSSSWLKTTSLEVENKSHDLAGGSLDLKTQEPQLKFKGVQLEFPEIVRRHKNVLLTGPAGSGKTTAFKLLATSWMCEGHEEQNLSFYIRLKEAEPLLEKIIHEQREITISELIGQSVISILRDRCSKNEFENGNDIQDLRLRLSNQGQIKVLSHDEILKHIRNQVIRWFDEQGCHQDKVIVLIDGINELHHHLRDILKLRIEDLSRKQCRVVVSCRSNFIDNIFPSMDQQFIRFELQELSKQQIVSYLEYKISGQGQSVFKSQIEDDPRLLSMAKNPFYLFLIAEKVKRNPAAKIPSKRSRLIEDFILSSIERKHEEGIYSPVGLTDDMVYVVLPKVAKWSLNQMTKGKGKQVVSFLDSKEFKDIQSPSSTLNTLQIGEKYGLLSFSGLLEESGERRGYPAFLHDNFRDFFAALYLQSIDQSTLMQQLSEIVEYYSWDEPLLFLLELSQDKDICRQIAEFVLSKEAVLAGMCARHANTMGGDLFIQIANAVSKLPTAFDRSLFMHEIISQDNIQLKRLSATYALERLSVQELAVIAQDKSLSLSLRQNAWISIPANAGQDDFGFLKDLWISLPKKPRLEVTTVLVGIAKIPTYEAFVFFTKAYKDIHTLPGFSTTDPMFGFPILALIAYSPTLSQALVAFSADKSPDELSVLISLVQKITTKELPLLEELISHRDVSVATDASKLLVKVLGGKAVPTLLKRLESLEHLTDSCEDNADIFAKWHHNEIRNTLLSLIVQLAPDIASSILVDRLKKVKNISSFTDLQIAGDERYLVLRLLADTRTIAALDFLVSYACNSYICKLADYCADLLEMWPDRTTVLEKLRDYTGKGYPLNVHRARLLGVRLGANEFCLEAVSIFEDLFSHTVLGHEFPAPTEGLAYQFYQEDPKPWQERCFEQALSMQPLAVRAMREIQRSEIADQVFKIIEWQCSTLNKKAIKIGLVSGHTSFSLLVECLLVLSHFASIKFCVHIIECFINSQCLINLSELITLRDGSFQIRQYHKKISFSILVFCESVPEKYVPLLFSVFSRLHQECINRISSDKSIDLEPISNILLSLCRRIDDNLVVDLLCSLKKLLCQNKKRDCQGNNCLLWKPLNLLEGDDSSTYFKYGILVSLGIRKFACRFS